MFPIPGPLTTLFNLAFAGHQVSTCYLELGSSDNSKYGIFILVSIVLVPSPVLVISYPCDMSTTVSNYICDSRLFPEPEDLGTCVRACWKALGNAEFVPSEKSRLISELVADRLSVHK